MRIAVFDAHRFEIDSFRVTNERFGHSLVFFETRLGPGTAAMAKGFGAVCPFVNDRLDAAVVGSLASEGVRLVALRSAGFNNVDLHAAEGAGVRVVRVPEYSPYAVAEHAVGLILSLNRKLHRAYARVREGNFSLEGLVGFDLHGRTVGIVGTGRIGAVLAKIMAGFGCRLLAYDREVNETLVREQGVRYVSLEALYQESDIISLHVPLNPETRHMIDQEAIRRMRKGVMLINTGRGALIETRALISALKSGQIGYAGLDVYEEEERMFFQDLSDQILQDDALARLLTFPNVLITSHQAFLTEDALRRIAETTLQSAADFESGRPLRNEVRAQEVLRAAA